MGRGNMEIKEISINDKLYDNTLELRTRIIGVPFGFSPPRRENETPDSHLFIAVDNEAVIGFAMITPSADKKSIRARQVSVESLRQKQGIGRLLMQKAEDVAKSLGYNELRLFAHEGSYPFFLKLHYQMVGDWQVQDNGLKTVLMSKKLEV